MAQTEFAFAPDRPVPGGGYWPSHWPVECGGNRRQKSAAGRLDAAARSAEVTRRATDRWEVMVVAREPGEWYVGGTYANFVGPPPHGWVERIDPVTLEAQATSPALPCGEHVWCGAILVHRNGSIYSVNGSYLHRLAPDDLRVEAERRLVDCSHNGLLALTDGTLITKDLRLESQGNTTVSRFDPETLNPVGDPLVLPEGSMGRIAADHDSAGQEYVYVPGTEHLMRVRVDGDDLVLDELRPRYRQLGADQGLAWDACLSGDSVWVMDNGDIPSVRHIHTTFPNGRFDTAPELSWRQDAPWQGAQRLLRARADGSVAAVAPFGTAGGGIMAPPVAVPERGVAIAWDSINGGLAGIDIGEDLSVRWQLDVRPTMQPVVFPDSGELVINDFGDDGVDWLIVVDVDTGELVDRVDTGSRIANGMFLTAGLDRDVYYCSLFTLARVAWS